MTRLSLSTLDGVPAAARPALDPRAVRVGIVHLGLGAFHRAHQAAFTEDAAAAAGDTGWGICGVTQRSADVIDQLAPQDGLYTLLERGPGAAPARVIGGIREVRFAGGDPAGVIARIADPAVRAVTLTVTEKGYRRDPHGRLDRTDEVIRADLAGAGPRSVVGQLTRGLQRRAVTSGAPITVLCCDNLTGNGDALRVLVEDFCAALPRNAGESLVDWISTAVRFPNSMVDRITPASTAADRAEVSRQLGRTDAGLVVTEPFRQWVLTDDFGAERPAWERAGALLVPDVAPYEKAKLRLLNAAHSLLAYSGALAGYDLISAAVADDTLAAAARALMVSDAAPTLDLPPGFDLKAYQDEVIERFGNPALRHRTVQIAMDGSQKLPIRVLGTVRDRLAAGAEPRWAARVVAAWMVYVGVRTDRLGRPLPVDDPLAATLAARAGDAPSAPALVDALLPVAEVFGPDLADSATFRGLLIPQVAEFLSTVQPGR
ncbi:MAG: fructuronate reductase [Mycobacteriales bacterium]